jgi:predicted O-methyltransferase YrrM
MKTKIALVAILAIGTLIGFSALLSAAHRADHGTAHTSSMHQNPELTQRDA